MSSKKRRAKRKIAQMVRMDQTRMRMFPTRQAPFSWACMAPLGKRLTRMGLKDRAVAALNASGTDLPD
jgi:hypothetical protein